jgi:hypothetical protein
VMINKTTWRKSRRSNTDSACVELNDRLDSVRDSKNPAGPSLRVDLGAFLAEVKNGRFSG